MSKLEKMLKELQKRLAAVERKLDGLLEREVPSRQTPVLRSPSFEPEMRTIRQRKYVPVPILSLPDHLQKTALTISTMGQATAEEVATETGRSRAAESDYLNQLVRLGILIRERRGKKVVFKVFSVFAICPYCGTRIPMNARFCPSCRAALTQKNIAKNSL